MNLAGLFRSLSVNPFHRANRKPGMHACKGQDWLEAMGRICTRLDSLVLSSGKSFLGMGERLRDFHDRAQKMSESAQGIVSVMTEEEIRRSTETLGLILDELTGHVGESEEYFTMIRNVLSQYMSTLNMASSCLDDFKGILLNLSMLGFMTRVENVQVFTDSSGFAGLTVDVKKLSERISLKSSFIKSRSSDLREIVKHTLSGIDEFEGANALITRETLKQTVSGHCSLKEKHDRTTRSAMIITEKTRDIAGRIGDIVMSLQFHDIIRQQIEHVKGVLSTLCNSLADVKRPASEQAGLISEVVTLQLAQLAQSRDEFKSALENVRQNLESIAMDIKDMLGEIRDITSATDIQGISFTGNLNKNISMIISGINSTVREREKLDKTVDSTCSSVSEMSGFVSEIENLGLGLQLIALNARIKAAQLGLRGEALDTISGRIYDLSLESGQLTRTLAGLLSSLTSISVSFTDELKGSHDNLQSTMGSVVTMLSDLTEGLGATSESVKSSLSEMTCSGESLARDISKAALNSTMQEDFNREMEGIMQCLSDISDKASKLCGAGLISQAGSFLSDIDRLYTMESEREIHQRHMGAGALPGKNINRPAAGDDLGDNVELF